LTQPVIHSPQMTLNQQSLVKYETDFLWPGIVIKNRFLITVLCAYLKLRNIFESGAKRRFQKYFCTTQSLNRLYTLTLRCLTYKEN
ncbi:MAG: hypothetical protein ACK474_12970, partial [Pseudanabaena sp.]